MVKSLRKNANTIYTQTSRFQLSMEFAKLTQYVEFTKRYCNVEDKVIDKIISDVANIKKRIDQINYKTLAIEAHQTAIDIIAGAKSLDPDVDFIRITEMAIAYHLYCINLSYAVNTQTKYSWWYGTFKTCLTECTATGRGYQKNHMSYSTYGTCCAAWEFAKISEEYLKAKASAKNSSFDADVFAKTLSDLIKQAYLSLEGAPLTVDNFSFTVLKSAT